MSAATKAGVLPPPELVTVARRHLDSHDGHVEPAAKTLGVSRSSLLALIAGSRVKRGTVVLIAQALGWPGRSDSDGRET